MTTRRNQQSPGATSDDAGRTRESGAMRADPSLAGNKPRQGDLSRPGVMGDETEEQNLNQPGDPSARISRDEVEAAFSGNKPAGTTKGTANPSASTGDTARPDDELDPEQPE
jgi:hypothetical protein